MSDDDKEKRHAEAMKKCASNNKAHVQEYHRNYYLKAAGEEQDLPGGEPGPGRAVPQEVPGDLAGP